MLDVPILFCVRLYERRSTRDHVGMAVAET